MSNNPTPPRIEREAMKYAKENLPPFIYMQAGIKDAYLAGHQVAENRAAPVVKALEDRLKEWEASYQAECAAIDRINKDRQKPIFWDGEDYKMKYPPIPDWVTQFKQILQTYKADK